MTTTLDPTITFPTLCDAIGLDVQLRKAVSRLGYTRPTLVQAKCLSLAVSEGRDLFVQARTGSGKTLAYLLPVLNKILLRRESSIAGNGKTGENAVRAVILLPTRELCNQVHLVLQSLTYYCDDFVTCAVLSVVQYRGGKRGVKDHKMQQELELQEATLRDQPGVIIATPAGLLTHIHSGTLQDLLLVEILVVDEADLVLSFGYSNDIAEIVKVLPRIYQGLLMSATLPSELNSLKKIILNAPVVLRLEQDDIGMINSRDQLKQFYISLPKHDKNLVVYVFLKLGLLKGKGVFFVNSTDAGYRLKLFLEQFHIRSAVLNAELPFRSRMNIIEQFNFGNFDYLIATDDSEDRVQKFETISVDSEMHQRNEQRIKKKSSKNDSEYGVSRGLDFLNVSFVVNVDFPLTSKSYTHRVGRTARGSAKGVALSLVDSKSATENDILRQVQANQPSISIVAASSDKLQAASVAADGNAMRPQEQPQPIALDFDLSQIEGFRYRVEDVSRAVTRSRVRETRAAELKAEILCSERLQNRLVENPSDLQLLEHDRFATRGWTVQAHLKHIPKYLLPRGMQVAALNKKKRKRSNNISTGGARRMDNDPLQAFDSSANLDDIEGATNDTFVEFMENGEGGTLPKKIPKIVDEEKIFANTKDRTGRSTAGRNEWKERHRKGPFSQKKRKSGKHRAPLGI